MKEAWTLEVIVAFNLKTHKLQQGLAAEIISFAGCKRRRKTSQIISAAFLIFTTDTRKLGNRKGQHATIAEGVCLLKGNEYQTKWNLEFNST